MRSLFAPGVKRPAAQIFGLRRRDWDRARILCLAACATNDDHRSPARMDPPPFMPVEFALPPDTDVNHDGTIVLGDKNQWYGTLSMSSKRNVEEIHRFYVKALTTEGWQELSQLVSDRVVMQFLNRKRGRACIVTIEGGSLLSGTRIEVVMSPLTEGAG